MTIKHTPTPWRIKYEANGFATVYDANNNIVPELTDVELGWTDTSVGNYHSPEQAAERLEKIVRAMNAINPRVKALIKSKQNIEQLCDMVNTYSNKLGLGDKVKAEYFYEQITEVLK